VTTGVSHIAHCAGKAGGLTALAVCAGLGGAIAPSPVSAQDHDASPDTRAIIMAPLLEDLSAGPMPSMRLSMERGSLYRNAPAHTSGNGAWAIAVSGLSAGDARQLRSSFGAFHASDTVVARTPSGGQLRVSVFDAQQPDWVTASLSPSAAEMPAWRFSADRPRGRSVALSYEGRFDTRGSDGELDMGLRPHAGISFGDEGSATEVGATVRVGQYLGAEHEANGGWWFFAGADRQALIYQPGDERTLRQTFTLQPYAMVGDQQAGMALRVSGVDVSLAYVRRETSWSMPNQSWDTSEDFAAFSLTWRR